MLLRIPEPYDFELSTTRFRNFGSDGATVWHEGGLHRVVAGREVRITAVDGGVAIEPWSEEAAAEVGLLLGLPFDLDAFRTWAAGDATLARVIESVPGLPSDHEPAGLRGARGRDHDAADLAAGGSVHSWQPRRAVRHPTRRGLGVPDARADQGAAATALHARSASLARRPSTSSSSRTPISTWTGSPLSTTMRSSLR